MGVSALVCACFCRLTHVSQIQPLKAHQCRFRLRIMWICVCVCACLHVCTYACVRVYVGSGVDVVVGFAVGGSVVVSMRACVCLDGAGLIVDVWLGRRLGGWVWWLVRTQWGGVWQSVVHSASELSQLIAVAFEPFIQIRRRFVSITISDLKSHALRSNSPRQCLLMQTPSAFLSRWISSVS